jgi:hypothetical protein
MTDISIIRLIFYNQQDFNRLKFDHVKLILFGIAGINDILKNSNGIYEYFNITLYANDIENISAGISFNLTVKLK